MSSLNSSIRVRKNTGEVAEFDVGKLRSALVRSGAEEKEVEAVIRQVSTMAYDGITTQKIYQIAYSILKKASARAAGRYRLKKAMLELGPTGYPFEKFVALLLQYQGFKVQVGQIVQGRCVTHELDVIARKSRLQLMVECKYHSDKAGKSDVKIPLYIHSRFLDVVETWKKQPENEGFTFRGMLVTNSRFTDDAMDYGICAGLRMVAWDYPAGDSLKDWIDSSGYHPITSLQSLNRTEKQEILQKGVVLCRELAERPQLIRELVYPERRAQAVLTEIKSMIL